MAKAKAVTVTKVKKKAWYSILAPQAQNSVMLGETYVTETGAAVGRIIHAPLKAITDNMQDANIYLKFKITQADGQNLQTEIRGYYLTPPSIKKMSRRNTVRLDDSFVVATKDGKKLRIKTIAVTIHMAVRSVCSALLRSSREYIAREAAASDFQELIQKLINRSIHAGVKKHVSKIYPIRAFEVKVVEFAREGKIVVPKAEEKASEEEEPTEQEPKKKSEKKKKSVSEEMMEEFAGDEEVEESETFGEEEDKGPGV